MKSTVKALLFVAMSAIIVLTAFVLYYNANPPTIWLIDSEQVLSDEELTSIQQELQSHFLIPIKATRALNLDVETTFNAQENRYDALKYFEDENLDLPGFNEYRIYFSNRDFYLGDSKSYYFYYADFQKRIAIVTLRDHPRNPFLRNRAYRMSLRMIAKFFGVGHQDKCGIMADYTGLGQLDQLDPFFCAKDAEWLESVKYLRKHPR